VSTFTDAQKAALGAKLDANVVRDRTQAGRPVSYVEGWHVIAEANRIFGFDGWQRHTLYCGEVSRVERNIGNPPKPGFKVGYEAKVRIIVGDIIRDGTGHGSGIATDLFDAIESAAKEAETDAMKRAFITFGNPFGLALYDKSGANVGPAEDPFDAIEAEMVQAIKDRSSLVALNKMTNADKWMGDFRALPDERAARVSAAYKAKETELKQRSAA
jgi:DNA repair and recombination protein RAD52